MAMEIIIDVAMGLTKDAKEAVAVVIADTGKKTLVTMEANNTPSKLVLLFSTSRCRPRLIAKINPREESNILT